MKFYVAELQNKGSFRRAEEIEAASLASAKRKASRMQSFYGTVLKIGDVIDDRGFIANPLSCKIDGTWHDAMV
jgi:hypothetical protein